MGEGKSALLKFAARVIAYFEEKRAPFIFYLITFSFIVLLRNFIEQYATQQDSELRQVFSYSPFYFALAAWYILLFYLLTRESICKVAQVVLVSFIIVLIPPILDLLINWGAPVRMKYISPGSVSNVFKQYFTGVFDFTNNAQSIGQRIETMVAVFISFFYFFNKTHRFFYSLFGAWLVYTSLFIFGLLAFLSVLPFEWLSIQRVEDSLFFERFYFLICLTILGILFWFYNKSYFIALIKDLRYARLLHFFVLLVLGYILFVTNTSIEKPTIVSENAMYFLLIPVAVIFSALFSIMMNNIYDIEADRISQRKRPLVTGSIPAAPYIRLAWVALFISLVAAALVNRTCFIMVALGIGNYFIYSCPPFRLKKVPIVSKFIVGISSFIMVLLGYAVFGGPVLTFPHEYLFFLLVPFALAGNFIDLKDYEGDKLAGIKTLPVIMGLKNSKLLIAFFTLCSYLYVYYIISDYEIAQWAKYGTFLLAATHLFLLLKKPYREWPVVLAYIGGLIALIIILIIR